MEHAIVILFPNDIPAAVEIAKTLEDYRTYVFDPTLVDRVMTSNLSNMKLVTWDNCIDYSELVDWSHAAAFELERALDRSIREVVPDVSIYSWQHLNLFNFFAGYKWFNGFWNEALADAQEAKFHIFMYDNPSHSVFPSFIPSLLLMQKLKTDNIEFSAYTYGKAQDDTGLVPNLCRTGNSADGNTILAHLPTCLYDHAYFSDELKASGKPVVNIRSKYWDVPIEATETISLIRIKDLDDSISQPFMGTVDLFFNHVSEKLNQLLEPYIASPVYRSRQSGHMAGIYRSQLVTYYLLEEYFKGCKPCKALLSEHDAGFHGAILTFAARHNIPVLLVPHSKGIGRIEFSSRNVTALTHPIQDESILDQHGKRVLNFNLMYPETFVTSTIFPDRIKKIGLLLNGLSLNGMYTTRYKPYIDGIKSICQWCRQNNIELNVRCRPGLSMLALIANETGIEINALSRDLNVPILEFAQNNDLCLMYDTPTTAVLEFLRNSIPILNPLPEDISWGEANIVSTRVVPRGSVETIINLLEDFTSDSINFHIFRTTQFRDYLNLFSGAYPLRHFL